MNQLTRREFVIAAGSAVAALPLTTGAPGPADLPRGDVLTRGGTLLFQGDSITDGGRNRTAPEPNAPGALGTGYPLLVASALLRREPDAGWQCFNRGVGGDRVPELDARWQEDAIALEPDVLSVLVGVNDYWHTKTGQYAGTATDYERGYVALLERTRRAQPSVRLLVLEPFVLPIGFVDDSWFPEFHERRAVAQRVAQRVGATFIPLQLQFDELAARTGPAYWAADGVHPTPAGHQLIAEAVLGNLGG
jgi:lysophospholipase L1-like esterase